ncbi:MAG TPA: exodeoxyribonuclease VII large subunit [Bryobacteraceae bacterium]
MEQYALGFVPERRIWSLRELSDAIRGALNRGFANIWISGEISGTKLVPSGHCYFVLKDADAQIKCVCWKLSYWRLKFKPKDGLQVLVRGRVDIYEQRSEYQFVVEAVEPQGHGQLQLAFEQLKQKLLVEGLFDPARKRPLPRFPSRIGIVSSAQGAVIRDFIEILSRRFPGLHIRLFPARVQGPGSADDIRRGLEFFGKSGWAEITVIARGGGSLEDLWTFNEEAVARAIAASSIPVVSAIGHEIDVTIADFVADLRAPTPSAAAEMIVCTRQELLDRIEASRRQANRAIHFRLAVLARRLHEQAIDRAQALLHRALSRRAQRVDDAGDRLRVAIRKHLAGRERARRTLEEQLRYFDLRPRLRRDRERLHEASASATSVMRRQMTQRRRHFEMLSTKLIQLNPRLVLSRGYAIVMNDRNKIVREMADAPIGSDVKVMLAKDALTARVTG